MLVDLLGGEAEDRRNPADQRLDDVVQRRLGAASGHRVHLGGVLAILDHIQIETAQFPGTEAMHLLIDVEEAVFLVGTLDARLQLAGAIHHPAIQRQHVIEGQGIALGVEAVEVGQQEA